MAKEPIRVLITNAAGPVALRLTNYVALGTMLGDDQPLILHLLHSGTDADEALLKDFTMSLHALPHILRGCVFTADVKKACNSVQIAILIGEFPKMSRRTLRSAMAVNSLKNYKLQAEALENCAAANCKVLVISFPPDEIALTLRKFAPSIPARNITCLTRVYHNMAIGHIRDKLGNELYDAVKNVIIWGKHVSPPHLDVSHAMVDKYTGECPLRELINDAWLGEFMTFFEEEAKSISQNRGVFDSIPLFGAAIDHIRDWVLGTPEGKWVSMGLFSDGSYNVPAGLIYSFPVTSHKGEWTIVQGLPLDEFSRKKMDSMTEELMQEQLLTFSLIERHLCGHDLKNSPSP